MRPLYLILLLVLAGAHLTAAQDLLAQKPTQTARQALLEMLTGTPETFQKHLLEATKKALLEGEDSMSSPVLRQFAAFSAQMAANRKEIETFDSGVTLLSMEEDNGLHKLEVNVESDDLMSDVDEIEVSFRTYKEGMLEPLPVVPRLTLSMKQEKEVWKLSEVLLALRLPLGDADFLKGLQKSRNEASESSAVASLRTLNTAEISYAAGFPERGFTCKLSELGGSTSGLDPNPEHAMLIDDVLASGKKSGYAFAISGCDGRPASKYQATAIPTDPESSARAFCSDESVVIRYAADGKAASCLSEGIPLN
jgi:hypothetical protein